MSPRCAILPVRLCAVAGVVFCAAIGGCIALPSPSAPAPAVTRESAAAELSALYNRPKPLSRPVVVLSGYRTLGIHAAPLLAKVRHATSGYDQDFLLLAYPLNTDFDQLADYVVREVEKKWPGDDPKQTVPVDVVGVSMGGLVGRWAALA